MSTSAMNHHNFNAECSTECGGAKSSESKCISENDLSNQRPAEYNTWCQAKKQAWDSLKQNPNAFFYRHVMPNETKKSGPWTEDEKKLFLNALEKYPDGIHNWGIFSRNIPGRVGYQCNSFYKRLTASGEISSSDNIKLLIPTDRLKTEKNIIKRKTVQAHDCPLESSYNSIIFPDVTKKLNCRKKSMISVKGDSREIIKLLKLYY